MLTSHTYHHASAVARDRHDRVVGARPARRGVHENVNVFVDDGVGCEELKQEPLDVSLSEALLQRVEGEAAELRRDQVRAILHDLFQTDVLVRTLPGRHQMEHVLAVGSFAILLAFAACELDAKGLEDGLLLRGENGQPCLQPTAKPILFFCHGCVPHLRERVLHLDEPRIKVDFARERRYGQERRASDEHERCHRLVEEARVAVRGLLENDDVAPCSLCRRDL